jgi:hypothetical protein
MTREEKTNLLNELLEYEENNDIGNLTRAERREFQQWINEALEQEPQTFEWCHNCKEFDHDKHCCPRFNKVIRNAVEEIKHPKTAHWIVEKGGSYLGMRNGHCSYCKDYYTNDWNEMKYCPNCGADMREVEE